MSGSVGTRAWILLLLGRDESDPLFLQFKEAQPSVLEPFLGRSEFNQHGQRVVEGQRMMQAAPDIMLGWERIVAIDGETKDFYIRQLWDAKGSAEIELMDLVGAPGVRAGLRLDARARARPFRGPDRDRRATSVASDSFDRAMASFAEAYADQNERDYAALQDAVASGRVVAADRDLTPLRARLWISSITAVARAVPAYDVALGRRAVETSLVSRCRVR